MYRKVELQREPAHNKIYHIYWLLLANTEPYIMFTILHWSLSSFPVNRKLILINVWVIKYGGILPWKGWQNRRILKFSSCKMYYVFEKTKFWMHFRSLNFNETCIKAILTIAQNSEDHRNAKIKTKSTEYETAIFGLHRISKNRCWRCLKNGAICFLKMYVTILSLFSFHH